PRVLLGGGGRSWLTPLEQQQRPPSPTLPHKAGQSHVEILDSIRACERAAGFQSCAHDPISIPMLRPFAENWPHAIALPPQGGREQIECAASVVHHDHARLRPTGASRAKPPRIPLGRKITTATSKVPIQKYQYCG